MLPQAARTRARIHNFLLPQTVVLRNLCAVGLQVGHKKTFSGRFGMNFLILRSGLSQVVELRAS